LKFNLVKFTEKTKGNKGLVLIILAALVLRTIYGLCINFTEVNTRYLQDYTQIYLIGLKFYTTKIWPYWGPDITYTATQIPGGLQGLLVGLPFFICELPEAPFILLNILSTLSLAFFAWYISKRITGIPKWFIYAWLLTAPWTINYSTTIINPSYVLAPAIFFFVAVIEMLPVYKEKIFSMNLSCFMMGLSLGWILQIHMSWVLLPFYIVAAFYFLVRTKNLKLVLSGLFSLGIGFILIMSTFIPTLVKFGFVTGDAESSIVFNISNLKNIDVITRFIAFSTFEARHFIAGGFTGEKTLLSGNLWAAPFILILFITGILQTIYYITFFFRKTAHSEFKKVKLFTIGSILLTYISYLFAVREVASYTFYLLLPVSFWFSFYCIEYLFKNSFWRKYAIFFILSGFIYHVVLAREYYPANSLNSKRGLITRALTNKDSRLFAYRRTANWEYAEREKVWKENILTGSKDTVISYFNNFDEFPPEILPESTNTMFFVSKPYSCQVDSINPFSIGLTKRLKEINHKRKLKISFFARFSEINDCQLVVSVRNPEKSLFWSGDKICQDSAGMNKWSKVLLSRELPVINDPSAIIGIYVWLPGSGSKSEIQLDDFKIDFE
jgi:hypothetical protein